MTYDEIIAIHQFYIDKYSISVSLNHMKQQSHAVQDFIDSSVDNFIDSLVDSGKLLNLGYLRKAIDLHEVEQVVLEDNLILVAFYRQDDRHVPVFLRPAGEALNVFFLAEHVFSSGPVDLIQPWTAEVQSHLLKDQDQKLVVLACFPFEYSEGTAGKDHSSAPDVKSVIQRFYKLLLAEKREIWHLYMYAFLSGFISLSLPLGIQSIINFVSSGQITTSVIVLISLIVVGTLLSGGLNVMQLYLVEYIQKRVFAKTAFDFTYRIPRLKIESVLNVYPPELMNRFFDVVTVQKGIAKILIDFSAAILQIVFGLILLTLYHPAFIILGGIIVFMIIVVIRQTSSKGIETSLKESKYKYQLAHWLQEMSRAISTFKLAGFTNLAIDKTDGLVNNYLYARGKHFKVLVIQYTAFTLFKTLMTAGLLILGSYLLIQREINLGQFVASEIIIILIMSATEKIILQLETVYDVLTSSEKLGAISDLPLENHPGMITLPVNVNNGIHVKVKDLYYRYPSEERDIIQNVSFDIASSQRVCLTGYKNSGKKTLINIVLGILQQYKGVVAFNGLSFRDVNRNSLISQTGDNISQEDIFDGTILENITLGRSNISIDDIRFAIDKSGLTDYVLTLPNGLSEPIVKGLGMTSTLLMNKIILARNIVHKPKLLILDDVFQGINRDDRNKILDFVFDQEQKWTVILLSDDEEVMKRCDKVLLMKEGKIVYDGKYDPLQLKANFGEII
jgi:ABC-type bacteriocin/lantibiotic exporter with double-glycine peptidase domain